MPKSTLQLNRISRDLRSIELAGILEARRATAKIKAAAMAAFRDKRTSVNVQPVLEKMHHPIVTAMLASHLQGERRSKLMAQQAGVIKAAHTFDAISKVLKTVRRKDFGRLQARYDTQALKVLNDVLNRVETKLRDVIGELIGSGAHVREAVETLNDAFDDLGLSRKHDYQLEGIFRTQTSIAYSAGRMLADKDPDIADMLWGYEYKAVGDDRTRPTHMALDGTRLPKDDPFWQTFMPPNGWNCRCQVIAIYRPEPIIQPTMEIDGQPVTPDKGFAWNAGTVFDLGLAASFCLSV